MEETIASELKQSELNIQNFRQTINQLEDRASSILSLTLQYKEIQDHFDSTQNNINERAKELRSIHESVQQKLEEVKKREEDLELAKESVNVRLREIEERENEFELLQRREIREIEEKEKVLDEKEKQIELQGNELNERIKEFEKNQLKEKRLVDSHVKIEQSDSYVVINNNPIDANAYLRFTIDGKALQIFLNEHSCDHDLMRKGVFMVLGLSSNPAKLVLDAMLGFYPPRNFKFKEVVVRRSCIFLLEILMKLRPEISPDVKNQAMMLCLNWMKQMKRYSEHSLEVLGYLQLLASFGLGSDFDSDELLTYLEIVAHHSQATELLRILGLTDKISGFVQNLIRKNKHIEAIRFIYAFELVNEFPLVPLLEKFWKDSMSAISKSRKRDKSIEERIEAASKIVDNMRAALTCIEEYKIESKLSKCLRQQIGCLENSNTMRKKMIQAPGCKSQPPDKEKICFSSKIIAAAVCGLAPKSKSTGKAFACPTVTSTVTPAPIRSQKQSGKKRPWSAVSAEDDQNAFVGSASAVTSTHKPSYQPVELLASQDFIQELIESNKHIDAIKYIYQSNMVDKFPPVHLLRDHLSYLKEASVSSKKRNNSISAQLDSIAEEREGLIAVINCIATHCLESELSPKNLKERVAELEKEMANKERNPERQKNSAPVFERFKTKTGPLTRSKEKLLRQQKEEKNVSGSSIATSDPLNTVTSSSSVPDSTATTVTVTAPPATAASVTPITNTSPPMAASVTPITNTSPPPIIVSAAAATTQAMSPSPVTACAASPITVTTSSRNNATLSATAPKVKKLKQETEKPKQVFKKGHQRIVSSDRHLNPSIDAAYYPRQASPYMHYGARSNTTAGYYIPGHYPPANSHSNMYYNRENPHYDWTPSNYGYYTPPHSWRP